MGQREMVKRGREKERERDITKNLQTCLKELNVINTYYILNLI